MTLTSSETRPWWAPENLAWLWTLLAMMSFGVSRAMLSITMVLLLLSALWYLVQNGPATWTQATERRDLAMMIALLFGLAIVSGLQSDQLGDWLKDLYRKLPFLLIPLSLMLLPPFSARQRTALVLGYLVVQTLIALLSLGALALNYEAVMNEVSRNASVTVITGVSHIYFGLTLAFAAALGLHWGLQKHPDQWFRKERRLIVILALIDFVALHLFTSRTGLVALYGALTLGGLVYLIQKRAWIWGLGLLLLLSLTPTLAYYLVPSFRVRVEVTRWDFQQYQQPDADLSYNSASLRLLAWETAGQIIREHPWTGVGLTDVKAEMAAQYQRNDAFQRANVPLEDPHNQYLHYLVGAGVGGLLLILLILLFPFWRLHGPAKMLMAALVGSVAGAMLFESILQRQLGMTFLAFFYLLAPQLATTTSSDDQAQTASA